MSFNVFEFFEGIEEQDITKLDPNLFQIGLGEDDPKLVSQQQGIADEILQKLKNVDPNAILAGGAPRNWWLNKPAKDLDFFVYVAHNHGTQMIMRWLSGVLGFPLSHTQASEEDLKREHEIIKSGFVPASDEECRRREVWTRQGYLKNPYLRAVLTGKYKDCIIQIMLMFSPGEIWKTFPINLCRIAYDGQKFHYSPVFLDGMRLKALVFWDNISGNSEAYKLKIRKYFFDYECYTLEEFLNTYSGDNWDLFPRVDILDIYNEEHTENPILPLEIDKKHQLPQDWHNRVPKPTKGEIRNALYVLECSLQHPETKEQAQEYLRKLIYGVTSYL